MSSKTKENEFLMKRASYASVTVAFILIIMKTVTFFLTGSVAILSSLFDSFQDIITSIVNVITIRQANEPADDEHRFGHGKAQAIGSLIQAFIIVVASCSLFYESINRFCHPEELHQISLGLWITVIAIILTILLVRYQSFVIQKTGALSIQADRAHYAGDIMMNIGVIVAMLLSYYLNWTKVDSLFGLGVSVYLFVAVYQIVRDSFKMLMDTEMPGDFKKEIRNIARSFPQITVIHDLRTRQSGTRAFVQFCVHLDNSLTLKQAHDITDKIEDRIKERFPDTDVIIHPEPEREKL